MKYKDLIDLSQAELDKKEKETRQELTKLQSQAAAGTTPKSPGQIRQLKTILARIKTLRNNPQQKEEVQPKDA